MFPDYESILKSFTPISLPDLDEVVIGALQYLAHEPIPQFSSPQYSRPLVVGSGNALHTGRILFDGLDALFGDEGNYERVLSTIPAIDALYIISASGGKHAVSISDVTRTLEIPVILLTSNAYAPALKNISSSNAFVYPHIREPYTYNTSTYLSMILGKTNEEPTRILEALHFATNTIEKVQYDRFDSFVFVLPARLSFLREMFETKFDELFGGNVFGRAFSDSELMHAKTVIPSNKELYIDFNTNSAPLNTVNERVNIPLTEEAGYGTALALGYFIIGKIQKSKPPFFKENIERYITDASTFFGQELSVISE